MCGILGVFRLNGESFPLNQLIKMSNRIAHRGPDGEGFFQKGSISLAHKRLSILDTSDKGAQPMFSKDGRYVVVFNGCIYNFKELRVELKLSGVSFSSNSDTEVLVEGLAMFGVEYVKKLNGMFAIAAWDLERERLHLMRDRFGVKPLYYWFNKKTLVFASEIKAILEHPDYSVELNHSALNQYFSFQNLFTYDTLFKGVEMLPQANILTVDKFTSKIEHHSWWDYDFSKPDNSMGFEDSKRETLRLFEQAVNRQCVSDVPVGSYLSGGMDSGSITAVASKSIDRLSTFTCGFDMSETSGREANFDERRDAELMANYFKTQHFEQVMNAGDLRWSLPKVVYHIEDLRVGMSYPNYYISRLASKFVKVCLQGTGGDELFGGYPWRYYHVFDSLSQNDFFSQYYGFWQRLVPDDSKSELFNPSVLKNIDIEEPRKIFERVFTFNNRLRYESPEDHVQNSLYFEIKTFLNGLLLVGDKLSMASGLEERFPFLDNDLVDFAMKIPVKYKLGDFQNEIARIDENAFRKKSKYREYDDGKNILRKAMGELIPTKIIERKKQGFSAPDESWYRGENASYVRELLLNPKKTISTEFIKPEFISKIVKEHTEKHINHRLLIWSLMSFEWWCKIFLNNETIDY